MTDRIPEENTHIVQEAAHALSDKDVRHFLRKFFYLSNEPPPNDEFTNLFTEDGVWIFADRRAQGRHALRKKMWEDIPHRDHSPVKIFSHGNHDNDTELMILGTTSWTYHEGHGNAGDWAAHCKLEKDDNGKVLCSYYQIITDTGIHEKRGKKDK
ncbi:MAG: hypothetical protein Q9201_006049 [Fulgogasparrea decipioides]